MSRLRGFKVGFRVWIDAEDTLAHCDECGETMVVEEMGEHVLDCLGDSLKEKCREDEEWLVLHKGSR